MHRCQLCPLASLLVFLCSNFRFSVKKGSEIELQQPAVGSTLLRFVTICYDFPISLRIVTISLRFLIRFIRPDSALVFSSSVYIQRQIWSDETDWDRNLGYDYSLRFCYDFPFSLQIVTKLYLRFLLQSVSFDQVWSL